MKRIIVFALRIPVLAIALLSVAMAAVSFTKQNAAMACAGLLISFAIWQFTVVLASPEREREVAISKSNRLISKATIVAVVCIAIVSIVGPSEVPR